MTRSMLAVGEERAIDDLLNKVADFYELEGETAARRIAIALGVSAFLLAAALALMAS